MMDHGGASLQPMLQVPNEQEKVLATFDLDTFSTQCGYPWLCPGEQPKIKEPEFYPQVVTELGIEKQVKELCQDMGSIFHETGMPMFPCIFHHCCLPFSPFCAQAYFNSQRKTKLDARIHDFNEETAKPKGLYARLNNDFKMFIGSVPMAYAQGPGRTLVPVVLLPKLEIVMNIAERTKYCNANGIPFDANAFTAVATTVQPKVPAGGFALPSTTVTGFNKHNDLHHTGLHHTGVHHTGVHHTGVRHTGLRHSRSSSCSSNKSIHLLDHHNDHDHHHDHHHDLHHDLHHDHNDHHQDSIGIIDCAPPSYESTGPVDCSGGNDDCSAACGDDC